MSQHLCRMYTGDYHLRFSIPYLSVYRRPEPGERQENHVRGEFMTEVKFEFGSYSSMLYAYFFHIINNVNNFWTFSHVPNKPQIPSKFWKLIFKKFWMSTYCKALNDRDLKYWRKLFLETFLQREAEFYLKVLSSSRHPSNSFY